MATHPDWLNSIQNPGMYTHPVTRVELIETHISWVILTGDWAYKFKKPVNLGFVDFTTLELRRADCFEEVRLNRRTAPMLYDGVEVLRDDPDGPQFGASGPILEYAVRMRQFSQDDLLEHCLARGKLTNEIADTVAREVAALHRQAAVASADTPFGEPDLIRETVQVCLDVLARADLTDVSVVPGAPPLVSGSPVPAQATDLRSQLKPLDEWVNREGRRLHETFVERKKRGWVRECHGDLHLGNIVLYRGKPTLFDCLEFNPNLRWIDVISDIAFLVMDLYDRGATPLAWRVLNQWLEQTGDYEGLHVLKYYLAYRALVRAKVAVLRLRQSEMPPAEVQHQRELLESYIQLATNLTRQGAPAIVITRGVSGSGKSFLGRELACSLNAVQIRSDVERKRLFDSGPASQGSKPEDQRQQTVEMYSAAANQKTYSWLQTLARTVIRAGYPVIVDAAFLRRADRAAFAALADELRVPFCIVTCDAPKHVLRERIVERQNVGLDASDADIRVLEYQLKTAEPIGATESNYTVVVDTTNFNLLDVTASVKQIIKKT